MQVRIYNWDIYKSKWEFMFSCALCIAWEMFALQNGNAGEEMCSCNCNCSGLHSADEDTQDSAEILGNKMSCWSAIHYSAVFCSNLQCPCSTLCCITLQSSEEEEGTAEILAGRGNGLQEWRGLACCRDAAAKKEEIFLLVIVLSVILPRQGKGKYFR